MTKIEMKKLMKPIVKECLSEMLLEEGLLSNLIGEVLRGQQKAVVSENRQPTNRVLSQSRQKTTPISDKRKMLADAIGNGAYSNIFENITPISDVSNASSEEEGDPGIDLSILSRIPGMKKF